MGFQFKEEPKPGAPAWMCTFADMMSLLLTFFVLLVSMSTTELAKFRAMAGSLRSAFGTNVVLPPTSMSDEILPQADEGDPAHTLKTELDKAGIEPGSAIIESSQDAIMLRLDSDLLFSSADATLKPGAYPVLNAIARYMGSTNYLLDVVGHTDNLPISTEIFPSNWELSAARAGQAVRYLTERSVPPARLRAIGRADTQPMADNAAEEGRERNRRVEFIFTHPPRPEELSLPASVQPAPRAADSSAE